MKEWNKDLKIINIKIVIGESEKSKEEIEKGKIVKKGMGMEKIVGDEDKKKKKREKKIDIFKKNGSMEKEKWGGRIIEDK